MFVEITKKENNSPTGMDALFKRQRDNGGITPEFAMEVLESTNHYGNIKQVAKHILSLKTLEERLAYKDFVISAVDRRETTPEGFRMLYTLACEGGYDKEFFEAYNKPKEYTKDYCNLKTIAFACKSKRDDIPQDVREYDRVILDYSLYNDSNAVPSIKHACKECCFKNVNHINVCQDESRFIETEKFKFSNIESVRHHVYAGVRSVEFADCDIVEFSEYIDRNNTTDLELVANNVRRLSIAQNGYGRKHKIKCKFDNVSNLVLQHIDLNDIDLDSFRGVKMIEFSSCYNLPKNLDFSSLDDVSIECSHCSGIEAVEDIKFKEGAKVCIMPGIEPDPDGYGPVVYYNIEIPTHIDFSKCSEVTLGGGLGKYNTLKFGEGSKVKLVRVQEYPEVLDVSKCAEVCLDRDGADKIKEIIVRDKEQLDEIVNASNEKEEEHKKMLSKLKKKAKFVNEEKSVSFLSRFWERRG